MSFIGLIWELLVLSTEIWSSRCLCTKSRPVYHIPLECQVIRCIKELHSCPFNVDILTVYVLFWVETVIAFLA